MSQSIHIHSISAEQFTGSASYNFTFNATISNPGDPPAGVIRLSRFADVGFIAIKWPAAITSSNLVNLTSILTNEIDVDAKFIPSAVQQTLGTFPILINSTTYYASLALNADATQNVIQLLIVFPPSVTLDNTETFTANNTAISNFTYTFTLNEDTELLSVS